MFGENQTPDVNQSQQSSDAAQSNVVKQDSNADSSAGTLNTESQRESQYVPYDRFSEVYSQMKSANQELESYKQKAELYSVYEQLDQILNNDETLAQKLFDVFGIQSQNQHQQQQLMQNQPNSDYEKLAQEVWQLKADKMLNEYANAYKTLAKDVPPHQAKLYEQMVEQQLVQLTGNPFDNFDLKALDVAFNNVKTILDEALRAERASYVESKTNVPPSQTKGIVPVPKTEIPKTQEEKAQWLAQMLSSGKNIG